MISRRTRVTAFAVSIFYCLAAAAASVAQQSSPTLEERLERLEKLLEETRAELAAAKAAPSADTARLSEIERQIQILAKEIEQLKLGEAAAAPPAAAGGAYGVGPAAAKVYSGKTGVSLGGYGEALYQNFARKDQGGAPSGKDDQVTLLRAVVYLGYKFDDHFLLNTELEYENAVVASDKKGEAEVEFAYIDYRHSRAFNARAGLVLIPMGLVNPLHEPTSFLGALRPDVEDRIIPSTWRELGLGVYGEAGPVTYYGYLVNGLNAQGYTAEGIREGRQEGSEALARNWAFTARLDYTGAPGLLAGAAIFSGRAGQGRTTPSGRSIGASTTVWDVHADWRWRGLWLRGLYARSHVADAALINEHNGFAGDESVGSLQEGWYLQAAFDVLSLKAGSRSSLFPFLRYEKYDTQAVVPVGYERNPENDASVLTVGLGFKPIEQLIVKADWQRRRNAARTGVNQWNVALGYIF
jgi:DNA-binding protein H-NS